MDLAKRTEQMKRERTHDKRMLSRVKSESTTARFVVMEQMERAKRAEPGPSEYQNHVTKRDFGVDGVTQKISNIPRLVPGHNYKQVHKGLILLQKDNSYLDVGPGQYEPSRGPAMNATKHAPQNGRVLKFEYMLKCFVELVGICLSPSRSGRCCRTPRDIETFGDLGTSERLIFMEQTVFFNRLPSF